ncbi:hypothetical protein F4776DRAFT_219844 [Hypoxylon sp. NC0597]|nr:hypothetical protein F4776DRAFT_219844 [Hypoxylon sp. NC0597]
MQLKEPLPPSVKPPYPPHTVVDNPQYKATPVVKIYHPVYPSKYKPLAQFLALDDGGIDYDLAYYACCLLLDNAWTRAEAKRPYFSLTPVPKLAADRVARGPDGILPAGDYYFYDPEHPDLDSKSLLSNAMG